MNVNFLLQGYDVKIENSVGNLLIKFLEDRNFHTFTAISAFASYAGIKGLSRHIKSAKKHLNITIITGVDQKATSKEALEEILALVINGYVFYQPSFSIFHPKIYLFEGAEKSELIIGSSNLTSQGLFTNVEASIHVTIDNNSEPDRKIIEQLKELLKGVFNFTDPNLKKISPQIISDLVRAKIVPTEEERKAIQEKGKSTEQKEAENFIIKIFPKRNIAKIPGEFKGVRKQTTTIKDKTTIIADKVSRKGELVWESGKLTERDLNIPKGTNTNPTGSMLFKKGKSKGIDQRHYFRESVFAGLRWELDSNPKASHLERASATFRIEIDGKTEGTFRLTVTHNTRTNTISYEQKNSMTSISWGKAKKIIAKEYLIGKSISLFKTKRVDRFILKIN